MGNIVPRAGIKPTSLAFWPSVLRLHRIGSLHTCLCNSLPQMSAQTTTLTKLNPKWVVFDEHKSRPEPLSTRPSSLFMVQTIQVISIIRISNRTLQDVSSKKKGCVSVPHLLLGGVSRNDVTFVLIPVLSACTAMRRYQHKSYLIKAAHLTNLKVWPPIIMECTYI